MIDPNELERLSKAAEQEDDDVRYYGGPTSTARPARDAYHAALVQLHRTGQLVPAQPSGDVVEAVALSLAEFECANWDAQSFNETPAGETPDEMRRGYLAKATAAITAYEAVSGVAKMRAALVDDHNWIAAGIPDEAIEAGIDAWDAANEDMQSPSPKKDWDEGMIVAAIFKAVARAALGEKP